MPFGNSCRPLGGDLRAPTRVINSFSQPIGRAEAGLVISESASWMSNVIFDRTQGAWRRHFRRGLNSRPELHCNSTCTANHTLVHRRFTESYLSLLDNNRHPPNVICQSDGDVYSRFPGCGINWKAEKRESRPYAEELNTVRI